MARFRVKSLVTKTILFLALSHKASALPLFPQASVSNVLCGTVGWDDLFMFFLLNYATHAVTVKAYPGNKPIENVRWILAALLAPYSGVVRGCAGIGRSRSITGESDLQHAGRAGALCALRRSRSWRPQLGDVLTGCKITGSCSTGWARLNMRRTETDDVCREEYEIHGQLPLRPPEGYVLSRLPQDVVVEQAFLGELKLARSPAFFKSLAGIFQLIYTVLTLSRTWGTQIEAYGWAAYGLTVIPYMVLTLINLVCHCVNPDYPALFIVENDILGSGPREDFRINGQVGRLGEDVDFRHTIEIRDVKVCSGADDDSIQIFYKRVLDQGRFVKNKASATQTLEKLSTFPDHGNDIRSISRSSTLAESITTTESSARMSIDITDKDVLESAADIPEAMETIEICDFGSLPRRRINVWPWRLCICLLGLAIMVPYLLIHALTGFKAGVRATADDRVWIMAQLAGGQILGVALWWMMRRQAGGGLKRTAKLLPAILLAGLPAIGGFVTVARMFLSFGNCQLGPGSAVL